MNYRQLGLLWIAILGTAVLSFAQNNSFSLFIDCNCDRNYLRQEIPYVNHVRDQGLADVQLFIFDIRTGSGGRSYTLNFSGTGKFEGIKHELTYETSPNMTRDEVRTGLLKKTTQGLLNYLLLTDMADKITFAVTDLQTQQEMEVTTEDPWNYWIFEMYGEGEWEKETSRNSFSVEVGASADRVTEDWRVRMNVELDNSESRFKSGEDEFLSKRHRYSFWGDLVRSLGPHWSTGISGSIRQSTFRNINLGTRFSPAIEYSLYPYEEVLRREITFAYRVGYLYNDYIETTIFDQDQEHLFNTSIDIRMRFRQPWGDIFTNLEGSAYLHDLNKNRLELDSFVSIRIVQGLAVRFSINANLIRDQINLPVGDATIEDILLRQRQIATDFEFSTGIGLSYTFGSAYNNIINTRL